MNNVLWLVAVVLVLGGTSLVLVGLWMVFEPAAVIATGLLAFIAGRQLAAQLIEESHA